jgi:DNA-binding response OmpR family regulator
VLVRVPLGRSTVNERERGIGVIVSVVLVVDDEVRIRELVRRYLEHEGHQVLTAGTGAEAIDVVRRSAVDLIVLDLRLPDISGEEVAADVRRTSDVPILMLTAKIDERDRIRGLEAGADDYVTKPFSPRELTLRVNAILRRGKGALVADASRSFGGGALIIDETTRRVTVCGTSVDLTPTEWGVLLALATQPGRVCSRYELINRVRGYEFDGYERTVDSHVKNLRHKIEADPSQPVIVQTVTGVGYRLGLPRDC